MKSLFKKNSKSVVAIVIAFSVTASMSFKAPEKIEAGVQEASSITASPMTEAKQKKAPVVAAVAAGAAVVAAAAAVVNAGVNVYNAVGGKNNAVENIKNENVLINQEFLKVSQFD
ncbi:hypothetical protein D1631_03645 [Chryseobacterium nematophagum]|uniref:Uncharacterized protein n=1 Tax=Chryseobacterium nematophagum TaxID=2305228 RepID=A0A3M7TCB0_9FLAO|nr:hypothetical protein [Chryseobacterium nematophagum]RNA61091.1 hypothetical protein D1631_03645 [Chryseobacterium nematophagum]